MSICVERCELASGLTISRVLTGMWQIADMERGNRTLDLDGAAAAMRPYIEAGLTTFDMADHYGSAEDIAGKLSTHVAPETVQLLTKWVPKPGSITRNDVRAAVQRSLDRLRVDQLDLLQFHTWTYDDPRWIDSLSWLQELSDEGLIRHLGLTNFDTAHLGIALKSGVRIVSNQVCFSLLDQRAAGPMARLCMEHGVKLLAYGTLAGGFLTERWMGQPDPSLGALETHSQMKYKRFIDAAGGWEPFQSLLRSIHKVAARYGVSMANVATRAILEHPAVGGVIVGARLGKSEHIQDTLRLFDFSLDDASRKEIHAALASLTTIPGDCGDEYRRPPFLTATGDLSDHMETLPSPYPVEATAKGGTRVSTGTYWEEMAGFCRAHRIGQRILVSGTTATHGDRLIGAEDAATQTHFAIDKIEGALRSLGGRLEDVIRTRIYVRDLADWEVVARVHGLRFGEIQPANTLVQADLVGDGYLVEMEAEAVVPDSVSPPSRDLSAA